MITGNCRGSFAKEAGADRYLPELTWAGSVLGRSITIGRSRSKGDAGRRRRRSTGVTRKRVPGHGSGSGLVLEHGRGTLNRSRGLAQGQGDKDTPTLSKDLPNLSRCNSDTSNNLNYSQAKDAVFGWTIVLATENKVCYRTNSSRRGSTLEY